MKKANRKRREKRKCRLKIIKRRKKRKRGKKKEKKEKKKKGGRKKKEKMGYWRSGRLRPKWRGKEVARRHREMAEGVWGKGW